MNYELGTLILGFLGFFQFDIMKLQFTTLEFGHSDIHLNFFFSTFHTITTIKEY